MSSARLIAFGLGAALILVLLLLLRSGDPPADRAGVRGDPARFEAERGRGAVEAGESVYSLGRGVTRVDVERPTLVQTETGVVVRLEPGRYRIGVEADGVEVTVLEGVAVLAEGERERVVRTGETGSLSRASLTVGVRPRGGADAPTDGPATTVVGRVFDDREQPVPNARVWLSAGALRDDGSVVAQADAHGQFRLDEVRGGKRYVGVEAPGFAPSDLREILPVVRLAFELEFVLVQRGGALRLFVRRKDQAQGIPGAIARIGTGYYRHPPGGRKSKEGLPLVAAAPRRLVTGEDGRAETDGLPPEWNRIHVQAPGFAPHLGWLRIPAGGMVERVVELARASVVVGVITDPAGTPAGGATVRFRQPGSGSIFEGAFAIAAADGSYRIDSAPVGKVEIVAKGREGGRASAWLTPETGKETRWDARLVAPGSIAGRLVFDDGAPVTGAHVACRRALNSTAEPLTDRWTDSEGTFRFADRPNVLHDVHVWIPAYSDEPRGPIRPPDLTIRMMPDESPRTITCERPPEEQLPVLLAGVVVRPGGEPAEGARVRCWTAGDRGWPKHVITAADGSFRIGPFIAGRFDLDIHFDGLPALHVNRVEGTISPVHDLGTIHLQQPGRIRARVLGFDGEPAKQSHVVVQSLDQRVHFDVTQLEGGIGLSEGLAAGRYLVLPGPPGQIVEAEVREGETTELDIQLIVAQRVSLAFALTDGSVPQTYFYRVTDAHGRSVFYGNLDHGESGVELYLIPGHYRVECSDERRHEADLEFDISGPTSLPVTLR